VRHDSSNFGHDERRG